MPWLRGAADGLSVGAICVPSIAETASSVQNFLEMPPCKGIQLFLYESLEMRANLSVFDSGEYKLCLALRNTSV